jgi:hypothetical protein
MAKAKKAKRSTAKKKVAAKSAAPKVGKAPEAKAKANDGARLPAANVIKSLASTMLQNKSRAADVAGDSSEAMRTAVDKRGIHKNAFQDALKVYAKGQKDAESVALYLQHRDHYEHVLGIDAIADAVPTLPMDVDDQAKAEATPAVKKAAAKKAEKSTATPTSPPPGSTVTTFQPDSPVPVMTFPLDDSGKNVVRPNFTDPAAERHLQEAVASGGKPN